MNIDLNNFSFFGRDGFVPINAIIIRKMSRGSEVHNSIIYSFDTYGLVPQRVLRIFEVKIKKNV